MKNHTIIMIIISVQRSCNIAATCHKGVIYGFTTCHKGVIYGFTTYHKGVIYGFTHLYADTICYPFNECDVRVIKNPGNK